MPELTLIDRSTTAGDTTSFNHRERSCRTAVVSADGRYFATRHSTVPQPKLGAPARGRLGRDVRGHNSVSHPSAERKATGRPRHHWPRISSHPAPPRRCRTREPRDAGPSESRPGPAPRDHSLCQTGGTSRARSGFLPSEPRPYRRWSPRRANAFVSVGARHEAPESRRRWDSRPHSEPRYNPLRRGRPGTHRRPPIVDPRAPLHGRPEPTSVIPSPATGGALSASLRSRSRPTGDPRGPPGDGTVPSGT